MSEEKKEEILDQEKKLDASELNEVSGGDVCVCVFGGGGEGDRDEKTCACVVGGAGEWDDNFHGTGSDAPRCLCVAIGGGQESI